MACLPPYKLCSELYRKDYTWSQNKTEFIWKTSFPGYIIALKDQLLAIVEEDEDQIKYISAGVVNYNGNGNIGRRLRSCDRARYPNESSIPNRYSASSAIRLWDYSDIPHSRNSK
jgi:hypothetical protein